MYPSEYLRGMSNQFVMPSNPYGISPPQPSLIPSDESRKVALMHLAIDKEPTTPSSFQDSQAAAFDKKKALIFSSSRARKTYCARTLRDDETNELDKKIWGGIQLIVSGDFFQLPPVLKRTKKNDKVYAFEADCWSASFDLQIELTTVFRQSDSLLIQLLQGIRKGENDPEDLKLLEGCCSGYEPDPSAVRLYPRIADVNKVNLEKMKSLENKVYVYKAQDLGGRQWMRQLKSGIAPDELEICVVSKNQYGMSNMCDHGDVLPFVKFDSGLELVVEPEEWVVMDGDKVVARRRQIPLILSWALSIHKCQGMTLDKLHTDLSRVFDFGMVYVALSREKFGGLYLSGLEPSKIKAHPKVLEFYHTFNSEQDEKKKALIADRSESNSSGQTITRITSKK
ncbi:hypothetical protein DH2020_011765 [Rehmannia glutinosa]|uniref:ATP-dependent DNA helicase n=1 Tax=Rehmannia glutinosa TaxID=99300 RepID=A0ABR0XEF3_REHGL